MAQFHLQSPCKTLNTASKKWIVEEVDHRGVAQQTLDEK